MRNVSDIPYFHLRHSLNVSFAVFFAILVYAKKNLGVVRFLNAPKMGQMS